MLMYCGRCGTTLEDHFQYCSRCGAATANAPGDAPRGGYGLTRPREGRRLAGVCAGVARYLEIDVTAVRIVWLLMVIFPPVPGVIAYIICWILMPADPFPPRQETVPVS
jgi:phage shock protein C